MPDPRTRLRRYSIEEVRHQQEQAFVLFCQRKSLAEIADTLGITVQTVRGRIADGIRLANREDREAAIKKDLPLIDQAIRRLMHILEYGTPEQSISASNALMQALKRRAAMLGYDAPQNILVAGHVEVKATVDHRVAEARDLLRVEATRVDRPAVEA